MFDENLVSHFAHHPAPFGNRRICSQRPVTFRVCMIKRHRNTSLPNLTSFKFCRTTTQNRILTLANPEKYIQVTWVWLWSLLFQDTCFVPHMIFVRCFNKAGESKPPNQTACKTQRFDIAMHCNHSKRSPTCFRCARLIS